MLPNLPHFIVEGGCWGNFIGYVEKKVCSFLPERCSTSFAWNAFSFLKSKIKPSILLRFKRAIASKSHFVDEERLVGWTPLK